MSELPSLQNAQQVITKLRPEVPTYCIAPARLTENARTMVSRFPGEVAYAVKCNSNPLVLRALTSGGISAYDVASVTEMAAVREINPNGRMHFMHPIKTPASIAEAYNTYGIRNFSVDHPDEIHKIASVLGANVANIVMFVRLSTEGGSAAAIYDLSAKFGARQERAAAMLRQVRDIGATAAICFHVGSQVRDSGAYAAAMGLTRRVMDEAGVPISLLDIGGGFPAAYLDAQDTHWTQVLDSAVAALGDAGLDGNIRLMCEPGRALVADGASLLTRVLLRDGDLLFINDGAWGGFSEALTTTMLWPTRAYESGGEPLTDEDEAFRIAGVTCDSCDMLGASYRLPGTIKQGDWIEFGMMGAYSQVLRTNFNGFGAHRIVLVDEPFAPD